MTETNTKITSTTFNPKWTRMLTGDRPTGALHLGHYVGSLRMRVDLQEKIDTFVLIADLHVLTTRTSDLDEVGHNIRECVLDYLSVGIDPEKSTIYLQSLVPEVLVNGSAYAIVRKRQSYEALLSLDSFADWQDDRSVERRRTG